MLPPAGRRASAAGELAPPDGARPPGPGAGQATPRSGRGLAEVPSLPAPQPVQSTPVSRRGVLALAFPLLLLTGCFTGERPRFGDPDAFPVGAMTGDPAIDAVLQKFDAVTTGPATAAYTILTKYNPTDHPALVVLDPGKRSVTMGNIRYITTETASVTCTQDNSAPCVDGLDASRVSDIGSLTMDFYAADSAKRLRRDAQAKIGPAIAHQDTIAEQVATCVDVPVTGGTATYCALDSGVLAKLDDGDVQITLTLYGQVVDPNAFVIPT